MENERVSFEGSALIAQIARGEYPTEKIDTKYGEFTLQYPSGRDYQMIAQRKSTMFGGRSIESYDISYAAVVDRDMVLSVAISKYPPKYPEKWMGLDIVDFPDMEVKNALYKAFNTFCQRTSEQISGNSNKND